MGRFPVFIGMNWTPFGPTVKLTLMESRWLSVEEIAAHLGIKPDTVYKWIERRNLPAHKVGRLWKFQSAEVDEWVRSGGASQSNLNKREGNP